MMEASSSTMAASRRDMVRHVVRRASVGFFVALGALIRAVERPCTASSEGA